MRRRSALSMFRASVHGWARSSARAAGCLVLATCSLEAAVLSFEGIPNSTLVEAAYSALGVSFSGATAFVNKEAGGTGDFSGEPSPVVAVFSVSGIGLTVSAGFSHTVSFYWSNPFGSTTVRIYSAPDSHGLVLAEQTLPATSVDPQHDTTVFTTFTKAAIDFDGTGQSLLIWSRSSGGVFVDDIEFTPLGEDPAVPEPATLATTLAGVAVIVVRYRCRPR